MDQSSHRYRYRSVGLPVNHTVDPLIFSSPIQMPLSPPSRGMDSNDELYDDRRNVVLNFDKVDEALDQCEKVEEEIKLKLSELANGHEDLRKLVEAEMDPRGETYLPTPNDDFDTKQHVNKSVDRFTDIPSSPESYDSQLEFDVNYKIAQFAQRHFESPDVLKIRNVSSRVMDLLTSSAPNDDKKLMDLSDDYKRRSDRVIQNFERLIDAYDRG